MKTKLLLAVAGIALMAAGCVQSNQPGSNHITESSSNVAETHNPEMNLEECSSPLESNLYERPRLLPNHYPDLEVLGPLFTASTCGNDRLVELLGETNSDTELTFDQVVILKLREGQASEALREKLEQAGFLYSEFQDVYHTRQAGTRIEDLLKLKPYADKFAADYVEDAYTAYDQDFAFRYPVDPKSNLCTDAPTMSDIGSEDYPVAKPYQAYDQFLGSLLTQYQCDEPRRSSALGTNELYDLGVNLILKDAPSLVFLNTLQTIGFVCGDGETGDRSCTHWKLNGAVPIKRLIHLEPFTEEVSRTDCINCG